jgi:hypothetical protein
MGERDAFGREQGEDTLAEMGWRGSWPATVTPGDPLVTPAPAEQRDAPELLGPAPPAFTRRRRRRRGGPSLAKLIVLVAFLGAGALAVGGMVSVGRDAVDSLRGGIEAVVPPSPTAPRSLMRAAPLRAALAKLPDGRLVSLRVAADRIDAVVIAGGTRHVVQVRAGGSKVDVKAPAGPEQARLTVDPAAPLRIARTAARRAGRSVDGVDYLVRTDGGWQLFFKNGLHYRATPSGRKVAKVG